MLALCCVFLPTHFDFQKNLKVSKPGPARWLNSFNSQLQTVLVLTLVVWLHYVVFSSRLPQARSEIPLELPKPIMVNWIANTQKASSAPKLQTETPQEQPKTLERPQAKPLPVKHRVSQEKPKALTKTPSKPKIIAVSANAHQSVSAPESGSEAPSKALEATSPPISAQAKPTNLNHPTESNESLVLPQAHANYLHNPAPDYPEASRDAEEEGKVFLRVFVNIEGSVDQIVLKKSSGYPRLDQSALSTVKHWRFLPAHRGSEKVAAWVVVPISFNLEG